MDTDDIEDVFKVLITANICSISIVNIKYNDTKFFLIGQRRQSKTY